MKLHPLLILGLSHCTFIFLHSQGKIYKLHLIIEDILKNMGSANLLFLYIMSACRFLNWTLNIASRSSRAFTKTSLYWMSFPGWVIAQVVTGCSSTINIFVYLRWIMVFQVMFVYMHIMILLHLTFYWYATAKWPLLKWLLLSQMPPCFCQWALHASMFLHVISQCSTHVHEMLDVLYNKTFRSGVLQHHLLNGPE